MLILILRNQGLLDGIVFLYFLGRRLSLKMKQANVKEKTVQYKTRFVVAWKTGGGALDPLFKADNRRLKPAYATFSLFHSAQRSSETIKVGRINHAVARRNHIEVV